MPGSIKLKDMPVDPSTTVRDTVNSFLAIGGDRFTVFSAGTNRQQGAVDLDATTSYFKANGTVAVPVPNRISTIN